MIKTIEKITWKFSPPMDFPCMRCRDARADQFVKIYADPDCDTIFFQCALCPDCADLPAAILFDDMIALPESRAAARKGDL